MSDLPAQDHETLRDAVLACGHDDFVSMVDVQACIFAGKLLDLTDEHQQLVVDTIRSLLDDGLVEIGVIPGRNDPGFKPWPGTLEEVMAQLVDRFVHRHDDRHGWEYTIWLNLTAAGQQASNSIVGYPPYYDRG